MSFQRTEVTTALLVCLWLTVGCDEHNTSEPSVAATNTTIVSRRSFGSVVAALGAVKPQIGAEVRVGARISGRVVRLHANIRDQVIKGQVIAELEPAELQATLAYRAAEVQAADARLARLNSLFPHEMAQAQAEVVRWEATTKLAAREAERYKSLIATKVVAQSRADEAQEKLDVAQAQRDSAQTLIELLKTRKAAESVQANAELDAAKALLATAEAQLGYATITAPISGVVGSVSTQEGETIAAGLNAPTFVTIVDMSRLMVEAYVDEVDIGKVQLQQAATFSVDAFPAIEFEAKVVAIYPKATIQDNVVKYIVALEVNTPYEGKLRPELTATVAIQLQQREVLAVPSKAVQRESARNLVYVMIDGKPQPREVKLGWKDGQWTEVTAGLNAGEVVSLMPSELK